MAASCHNAGSNNFSGPVSCHHTLLCFNGEIPVMRTKMYRSPLHHPTRLGWAAVTSIWFSAVVVLISYCTCKRATKSDVQSGKTYFTLPACSRQCSSSGAVGAKCNTTSICTRLSRVWSSSEGLGACQKPFK